LIKEGAVNRIFLSVYNMVDVVIGSFLVVVYGGVIVFFLWICLSGTDTVPWVIWFVFTPFFSIGLWRVVAGIKDELRIRRIGRDEK
jgi:hypothetical protein